MSDTPQPQPAQDLVKLGEVPNEVLQAVNGMRTRAQALTLELGRLEMRKVQLVHEVNRLENSAQGLLRSEADRIGIPEGTPWQLTPEGHAMVTAEVQQSLEESSKGD